MDFEFALLLPNHSRSYHDRIPGCAHNSKIGYNRLSHDALMWITTFLLLTADPYQAVESPGSWLLVIGAYCCSLWFLWSI